MSSIDVSVIHARKEQWEKVSASLQERLRELNTEMGAIQGQLAQLSGALQACDVLLVDIEGQPKLVQSELSTLDNNG